MNQPIFERDPSDPERKEINPVLKLALELGPLMVFFFANSRGEWLAQKFPALADLGGPLFIATALFSLEKATRSSVVLGLVGAGGIGIELKVAMDLFSYDLACTIIICVFLLVLLVERGSSWLRAKIL